MSLQCSDSAALNIPAVEETDRSDLGGDGALESAPTFRPVPDRRQLGDRRGAFRGGRRVMDAIQATIHVLSR
jgi:hypothetical protein